MASAGKKILNVIAATTKKVAAIDKTGYGAVKADIVKTVKAMAYQEISEIIEAAKKEKEKG